MKCNVIQHFGNVFAHNLHAIQFAIWLAYNGGMNCQTEKHLDCIGNVFYGSWAFSSHFFCDRLINNQIVQFSPLEFLKLIY